MDRDPHTKQCEVLSYVELSQSFSGLSSGSQPCCVHLSFLSFLLLVSFPPPPLFLSATRPRIVHRVTRAVTKPPLYLYNPCVCQWQFCDNHGSTKGASCMRIPAMSRPCLWRTGKGLLESQYPRSSFRIVDWQVYYARLTVYAPFQKKGTPAWIFYYLNFRVFIKTWYRFNKNSFFFSIRCNSLQWRVEKKESYKFYIPLWWGRGDLTQVYIFTKRMIERWG